MTKVARREFFRLGAGHQPRRMELSCERLYMRYLDSLDELTSDDLLRSVERDMVGVATLHLTCTGWLAREDFRSWLEPLLNKLEAHGVRVIQL